MDSRPNQAQTNTLARTSHSSLHLSLYEPLRPAAVPGYRECRKNHAARLGRLALDGCREFMPSTGCGATGSSSDLPAFLMCAACGCHRNFHRRDYWGDPDLAQIPSSPRPLSPVPTSYFVPAPWMLHDLRNSRPVHEPVTMTPSSEGDDHDDDWRPSGIRVKRKRERTKFTKEQKEKMEAFAEKVGWKMKINGSDNNKAVEEFCKEVGVSQGVLKIWMNNHKQRKLSP